jgi:hypothetical protein
MYRRRKALILTFGNRVMQILLESAQTAPKRGAVEGKVDDLATPLEATITTAVQMPCVEGVLGIRPSVSRSGRSLQWTRPGKWGRGRSKKGLLNLNAARQVEEVPPL